MRALEQIKGKYHVDKYGNPQSIHILKTYQVAPTYNQVLLDELPDEYKGITILYPDGMRRVYNPEEIDETSYYINDNNNIIYFHKSMAGKEVKIDYHGIGNELIGADRIYTTLDDKGNIKETLGDILESGKTFLESAKTMNEALSVMNDLKNGNEEAQILVPKLLGGIYTGKSLEKTLTPLVDKANSATESLQPIVAEGKEVENNLTPMLEKGEKLSNTLNGAIKNTDIVYKEDFEDFQDKTKQTINDIEGKIKNVSEEAIQKISEKIDINEGEIDVSNSEIQELKFVKKDPWSSFVTFIPSNTYRYLQSMEVVPEHNEIVLGYKHHSDATSEGEIQKIDYYTKQILNDGDWKNAHCFTNKLFGHANDLAYYPKTNELFVCTLYTDKQRKQTNIDDNNKLLVLDYDSMSVKRWQTITGLSHTSTISGVTFNREKNVLYIKMGGDIYRVNPDTFEATKEFTPKWFNEAFQTMCSRGDYVYLLQSTNLIVYNTRKQSQLTYHFNNTNELEGCALDYNGQLLIGEGDGSNNLLNDIGGDMDKYSWIHQQHRMYQLDLTRPQDHRAYSFVTDRVRNNPSPMPMYNITNFIRIGKVKDGWITSYNNDNASYYGRMYNDFIKVEEDNNGGYLKIYFRSLMMYTQNGGVLNNYHAVKDADFCKQGIDMGVYTSTDSIKTGNKVFKTEYVKIWFIDRNGKVIKPKDMPNLSFRLYLDVAIRGM